MVRLTFIVALLFVLGIPGHARSEELCIYLDSNGKIVQVNSRDKVPQESLVGLRCFQAKKSGGNNRPADHRDSVPVLETEDADMASPEEIKLSGNIRTADIASSIGRVNIRWPRSVENLFGRTPERAMVDASRTVSRYLKSNAFPLRLKNLDLDLQVVFMDEEVPETQIPAQLVTNCHPGWMTPPANIYIVAQRVAAGCGSKRSPNSKVADADLARVLVHELGHAVEFAILNPNIGVDRARAEGFATWFEQNASDLSSVIPKGSVSRDYLKLAESSVKKSPDKFVFVGSGEDYARASLFFFAIVKRRGVGGLMDIYQLMDDSGLNFYLATQRVLNWDEAKLNKESIEYLNSAK